MKIHLTAENYIEENVRGAAALALWVYGMLNAMPRAWISRTQRRHSRGTFTLDGAHLVINRPTSTGEMASQHGEVDGNTLVIASDPDYKNDVSTFKRV